MNPWVTVDVDAAPDPVTRQDFLSDCHQRMIDAIQSGRTEDAYVWTRIVVHLARYVACEATVGRRPYQDMA